MSTYTSASQSRDLTPVVPRKYRAAFYMLVCCFALWGLVNAMAEVLVKAFESIFPELGQMGTVMTVTSHYGAYAVLAIPASIFIKKFTYKAGVLLGLGIFFIGVLGYVPAAALNSYEICLCSIFVYASGCSILETTCNPFVLVMGPAETAVRRLNFAQQFNPVGCLIGLCVAKFVIFDNIAQAPEDTRIIWLVAPYICLAVIVLCLWLTFKAKDIPEAKASGEDQQENTFIQSLSNLARLPRYRWGCSHSFSTLVCKLSLGSTCYTMPTTSPASRMPNPCTSILQPWAVSSCSASYAQPL